MSKWTFFYFHNNVFLVISHHSTLRQHAFPLNHYIHIRLSASSFTCSSSTTKKKHHLRLLSSITKALRTHTLASFWGKQSCQIWHQSLRSIYKNMVRVRVNLTKPCFGDLNSWHVILILHGHQLLMTSCPIGFNAMNTRVAIFKIAGSKLQ